MKQQVLFVVLGVLSAAAFAEENTAKCRTVRDTMLTCLEATVEDLPKTKQEKVEWLLFVRSTVPTLTRETMKVFPGLTDLHSNSAGIENIEADAFAGLTELNWVDLSYNKLSKLDEDLFKSAINFYYLNVSGNPGLVVPRNKPFLNSPKMNWLDLSYTGVDQLYPETFTKLRGLKVLSLAGNNLKTLPQGVFEPLHKLYSLDLSKNQFQSVGVDLFTDIRHIALYLGENPWDCDCSLYPFIEWAKDRRLKDEVRCAKPDNKLWKDVSGLNCNSQLIQA